MWTNSSTVAEHFAMAGPAAFPLLGLGGTAVLAAIVLSFVSLRGGRRRLALVSSVLLVGLGCAALVIGAQAQSEHLEMNRMAVAHIDPADAVRLQMAGQAEARMPRLFGQLAALVPVAAGIALLGWALGRPGDKGRLVALSTVVAALGAVAVLAGAAGRELANHRYEEAWGETAPEDRPRLVSAGSESAKNWWLAGRAGGLPLMAGGAGLLVVGLARRRRDEATPRDEAS